MKRNLSKTLPFSIPVLLAGFVLFTLFLTGCGKTEDVPEDPQKEEWIYVPEFFSLSGGYIDYGKIFFQEETLHYFSMEPDEAAQTYAQHINRYSLTDRVAESYPLIWPEEYSGMNMHEYAFEPDGSLYLFARAYSQDPPGSTDFLCKFDPQGNCLFVQNITEQLRDDPENQTYISSLAADAAGRVYLLGNDSLWLYDAEGGFWGHIRPDSENIWFCGLFPGGNDKMYLCHEISGNPAPDCTLAEIDFENKTLVSVCTDFPRANEFAPGDGDALLMHDRSSLCFYNPVTREEEKILDWLDCDVNGNNVLSFGQLETGRLIAVVEDSEKGGEIALLTRKKADQAARKETIVLGVLRDGYNYQPSVVKFNRSQDKYHVTIKEYYDYEDNSATAWTDALSRMQADLVSGNCPHIIELSGLDVTKLAQKGAFADLTPFLENSVSLHADDFLDRILELYTFDGTLTSIPSLFFLETVMAHSSQTGPGPGWSLEELTALADANPEAELFDQACKKDILNFLMMYNRDSFIDWEKGQCRFDSKEFQALLAFANRFPEEAAYSPDQPSTPIRIQKGEVLLKNVYLYDFDSIQMDLEIFGEDALCIGFPTMDGSARHSLTAAYAYAIPSKSENKEGAWAFIENFLSQEDTGRNQMGFPTRKSRLDAMIEDATKIEYILDENGNPVILGNTQTTSSSDGWSYTYHTATQEEVDMILNLLDGAALTTYGGQDEITDIITQETEAYFCGQKTVEEVSDIIQNRISVYVNENL